MTISKGIGSVAWNSFLVGFISVFALRNSYNLAVDVLSGLLILLFASVLAASRWVLRIAGPRFAARVTFGILFLAYPKIMLAVSGVDVRYMSVAIILINVY
jgi:hypothetical protein